MDTIIVLVKKYEKERKKVLENQLNEELKSIKEIQNKKSEEIFSLCGISRVMPISFDKLSKTYKVNIMGTDFSYLSNLEKVKEHMSGKKKILGMVNIENDIANIYYNNNPEIDIPTQRFTIAHELGHCINHYNELSKNGKLEFLDDKSEQNESNSDVHEYVCDKFARDFLIPTEMLKKIYSAMHNPNVLDLANLFLVPEEEMKIKLDELCLGVET